MRHQTTYNIDVDIRKTVIRKTTKQFEEAGTVIKQNCLAEDSVLNMMNANIYGAIHKIGFQSNRCDRDITTDIFLDIRLGD